MTVMHSDCDDAGWATAEVAARKMCSSGADKNKLMRFKQF